MQNKKEAYIVNSIFVILAIFLIFYRLDYPLLWLDEADTAILGKRVISFGVPKVWDGRNFITGFGHSHQMVRGQYDFNSDLINCWVPWPPLYITAASMLIFGTKTLACRLPFALIGFLVFIYYLYFCKKYLKLGRLYYLPGLLLLFSVPFLASVRQCRYYSLNIILSLMFVDSFISLSGRKKYSDLYFAFVGSIMIFNNALPFVPAVYAFLIYILLNFKKRFDIGYMARGGFFLLLGLVSFIGFRKYIDAKTPPFFSFAMPQFFETVLLYMNLINSWSLPFALITFLAILIVANRNDKTYISEVRDVFKNDAIKLLALMIPLNILFLSAAIQIFFRYILHLIPFLLMLAASILYLIYKKNRILYLVLVLCILFTDTLGRCVTRLPFFIAANAMKKSAHVSSALFARFPEQIGEYARVHVRRKSDGGEILNKDLVISGFIDKYEKINISYPLFVFLTKIIKPYPDATTCIVEFLMKNAKRDDVVVTNYDNEPIIFYTDLITRGGTRGVGVYKKGLLVRDREEARAKLFRQFGIQEVKNPDWIIVREHWDFKDELLELTKAGRYERIDLKCPDTPWGNNPDPNYYIYYDGSKDPNVSIYKRMD